MIVCSKILAWGEDIRSIEADFLQIIESEDGIPAQYSGKILAKAPSKVKWDYTTPLKKSIYMQEGEVLIYEPDLEQVSHSSLRDKSDFISIIKSAKLQSDGAYHAKIDNIIYKLYVDKANKPERIEFVDNMGAKTTLKLSNVKLNKALSDKIFIFNIPKGVDIVELKSR